MITSELALVKTEQTTMGYLTVYKFAGIMNSGYQAQFESLCGELLSRGTREFVFDLSCVVRITHAVVRSISAFARKVKELGGHLFIMNSNPNTHIRINAGSLWGEQVDTLSEEIEMDTCGMESQPLYCF